MTPAEMHHQCGNRLRREGRTGEALAQLQTAARLQPENPLILLNLGSALLDLGQAPQAAEVLAGALRLVPTMPEAQNILGCALLGAGRTTEARTHLTEALRLRPGYAAAQDNLGRVCRAQGRMAEALQHFQLALAGSPSPAVHSNYLLASNYADGVAPLELVARHREWDALHGHHHRSRQRPGIAPLGGRRLRIGYVSPDFCQHAVAFVIAPVLATHVRSRVEIFCYHSQSGRDAVTAHLRTITEHWRDIVSLDDEAAAALIRNDGIDILVDLAGHTKGNRLLVFARQPAPVQLTWLGYPNTTGLTAMDGRITDSVCVPPGDDARHGPERLIRLPGVFCCYQPPPDLPPAVPPGRPASPQFTFCSFSNLAKVSDATIAVWAQILRQRPNARLLLKSPGAGDPSVQEYIRNQFVAHGAEARSVQFNGEALPMRQHLELYHGCDLALDPFPYNGTTTTCEALLMGVPVVTLAGATHVSRVGTSFLTCLGLSEWVAATPADYIRIALRLADDGPRLVELRTRLRPWLLASPLGQAETFTRNLEAAWDYFIRRQIRPLPEIAGHGA